MPGVKQFDVDEIVERAMRQFWRAGYSATSIQDLERVTKLRRGSLYNAFGDKERLFIKSLKHYDETVGSRRTIPLLNPDPYLAISGFFDGLVEQLCEPGRPRGCLHTNASLEVPRAPNAIMRLICERTAAMEARLYSVLLSAKQSEAIDGSADIRALARFYLATAKGITVLHRLYGELEMLKDVASVAMSKWPTPR